MDQTEYKSDSSCHAHIHVPISQMAKKVRMWVHGPALNLKVYRFRNSGLEE